MTDILPPLAYVFDYHCSPEVRWSDGERTFVRDYSMNAQNVVRAGAGIASPVLLDLIEIAFAVYFSDRLGRRRDTRDRGRGGQWCRRLVVRVGVRDVALWMRPDVQVALSTCLNFLTEDRWEFEFLPRRAARWDVEQQSILIDPLMSPTAGVMLYSGGLDSFAGLAAGLGDEHSEWVLVSGVSNFRHKALQAAQIAAARHLTERHLYHLTVPYGLATTIDMPSEERSQRARSFLFLTLGFVAAERIGADTWLMCENGIGAINLPLDGTQIGTSNARAAHPATLLRFNRLTQCLVGDRVHVRNPFWAITKGEACQHPNVRSLGHAISETVSCDKFPLRVADVQQCGICTSCLLRRVSLVAAGLQVFDKPGEYRRDLTSVASRRRGHSLHGLQAMEWQFQHLSHALRSADPWAALSQAFPDMRRAAAAYQELEGLPSTVVREKLVRLYSQYAREWERFPAREHLAVPEAA